MDFEAVESIRTPGEIPKAEAGLFDTGQGASPRFLEVHLI